MPDEQGTTIGEGAEAVDWQHLITKAVVAAYYPDAVRLGGTARQSAQASFGSLAGLVGAGTAVAVSLASGESISVRVLMPVVFLVWLYSAWLFARTSLPRRSIGSEAGEAKGAAQFVRTVLQRAQEDQKMVARHQRKALAAMSLAGLATTVGLFMEARASTPDTWFANSVVLSGTAQDNAADICGIPFLPADFWSSTVIRETRGGVVLSLQQDACPSGIRSFAFDRAELEMTGER